MTEKEIIKRLKSMIKSVGMDVSKVKTLEDCVGELKYFRAHEPEMRDNYFFKLFNVEDEGEKGDFKRLLSNLEKSKC